MGDPVNLSVFPVPSDIHITYFVVIGCGSPPGGVADGVFSRGSQSVTTKSPPPSPGLVTGLLLQNR